MNNKLEIFKNASDVIRNQLQIITYLLAMKGADLPVAVQRIITCLGEIEATLEAEERVA